ncbi:xanthine dehydrogenase accessory protein XdhC [Enterococcus sp. CSURQ0835]|uniref:xanthine dehydrogenase accessory protein XdhC n=1 Tax=Enterococcus sp. CSURQ0835 TaxID=2681394 RepID=UPI00135BDCFB|nr:xanthine dehydrogenase accessory protein XdhC [Enterococcus sp. CSURQ0835]
MKEIFEALLAQLQQKKACILVTITESHGSTPQKTGAMMLVNSQGRVTGTIGGGAIEFQSIKQAQADLAAKKSVRRDYNLARDFGMVCGGQVSILFQTFQIATPALIAVCQQIIVNQQHNRRSFLFATAETAACPLTIYTPESGWLPESLAANWNGAVGPQNLAGSQYVVFELKALTRVVLFGAGHVSQAIVPVLTQLDFYCVVADDREDYLTETTFPTANERRKIAFDQIDALQIAPADFAVVITRGHLHDFELAKQLLQTKAAYIGLMGSRQKIALQRKKLTQAGFSQTTIDRINMPIGLEIGAESPAELAISVAGELIARRAQVRKCAHENVS